MKKQLTLEEIVALIPTRSKATIGQKMLEYNGHKTTEPLSNEWTSEQLQLLNIDMAKGSNVQHIKVQFCTFSHDIDIVEKQVVLACSAQDVGSGGC